MTDIDTPIMGTPFYTYHKDKEVWLGVILPFGVFALPFNEMDWRQWLREEMERSHPIEIPKAFLEMK